MNHLSSLTGLRFFAALWVFFAHFNQITPLYYLPDVVKDVISLGPLGVNVFFALSGFILTYGYHRQKIGFTNFIKKRVFRIYPVYFVGILLCLAVYLLLHQMPSVGIVFLNVFMLESFVYPHVFEWYGGGWSVSAELFFYCLFPFVLPWLLRIRPLVLWTLLGFVIIASSVPGVLFQFGKLPFNFVYVFPVLRFPEFLAGMIMGILTFRYRLQVNIWLGLLVMSLALIYLMLFGSVFQSYVIHNVFFLPAILVLLNLLTRHFKWMGSSVMVYLGQISYSFYIVQISVVAAVIFLIQSEHLQAGDWSVAPIAFVFTLVLSVLMYEIIEKPFQRWLRNEKPAVV